MWNRIDRAKRQRKLERLEAPADLAAISEDEARAFIKDLCGLLGAWALVQITNEELEREVADVFISQYSPGSVVLAIYNQGTDQPTAPGILPNYAYLGHRHLRSLNLR